MIEIIVSLFFSTSPVKQPEKPLIVPQRAITVWRIEDVPFVDDEISERE